MGKGRWGCSESLILGSAEVASFSSRGFSHSDLLYQLDISTFYFYEPLLLSGSVPREFIKT